MMKILKSKESSVEIDEDQGYTSAIATPTLTPCTSPDLQTSPATSTCSSTTTSSSTSTSRVGTSYRPHAVEPSHHILDYSDSSLPATGNQEYHTLLPIAVEATRSRVDNADEYRFFRSCRLLDTNSEAQPSTSLAVKRGVNTKTEVEAKRRLLGP